MSHPRKLIRHAIRDALDGATAAGARVYATRKLPLRRIELPAVTVWTLEESVAADSRESAPRELERELSVVIEGWVSVAGDAADDAMDDLAEQIEAAMNADRYLGDTAADSVLDSTAMEVVEDGDRLMGLVALSYSVTYYTEVAEDGAPVDDFLTAEVTHDLGGNVHPDEVAVDLVTIQEAP